MLTKKLNILLLFFFFIFLFNFIYLKLNNYYANKNLIILTNKINILKKEGEEIKKDLFILKEKIKRKQDFEYKLYLTFLNDIFKTNNEKEKKENIKRSVINTIKETAKKENFNNIDLLLSIARAESGYNYLAIGILDNRDRGLYQINSYYNKDVDDFCSFDIKCSTIWTINEIKAGRIWKWSASRHNWENN